MRIISHEPSINEIDVPRNSKIKIKFDTEIVGSSVTYMTFSVNDAKYYTAVPGQYGIEYSSGVADTVVFTPDLDFSSINKYRVFIYGKPNGIFNIENKQLDTTYMYEFTTGSGFISDDNSNGIPSGIPDVVDENTKLEVIDIYPKHQQPNISGVNRIDITFNMPITSSILELNDLISLDIQDVLF